MIGKKELSVMKNEAILVNISRGRVVDETALYETLRVGQLASAGLDVLASEPPDAENPLLELENVVLTPHCSAHTKEMFKRLSLGCTETIVRFFRGERPQPPANIVNPEAIKDRGA
jgi:phosphogluconate 2-dehydrogenase